MVGGLSLSTWRTKSASGTFATRIACLSWWRRCRHRWPRPCVKRAVGLPLSMGASRRLDLLRQLAHATDRAGLDAVGVFVQRLVIGLLGVAGERCCLVSPALAFVEARAFCQSTLRLSPDGTQARELNADGTWRYVVAEFVRTRATPVPVNALRDHPRRMTLWALVIAGTVAARILVAKVLR